MMFSDQLLESIKAKGSPICVGIDPMIDSFPPEFRPDNEQDVDACVDAIHAFSVRVLEIVAPHVPIVKFQSAYFEKYLWEGVEAYYSLVEAARAMGLLVIGDVKRGDIGATSAAYAAAHLEDSVFHAPDESAAPDAITVNPFLGLDTIEPFLKVCRAEGKGIFVLVRTSNPGSKDLQDVLTADGRTFSELLADSLAPVAAGEALVGVGGWSNVGAVVGATQPQTMQSLRKRLPHSIFLLPGYGAQGATAEMTRAAFTAGQGAIVSASRSILYAHREKQYIDIASDWPTCVERAVLDMKDDLSSII